MQKKMATYNLQIGAIIDDRANDLPNITKYFRPLWPSHIFPCQKVDPYGTIFPKIPSLMLKQANNVV